MEKVRASLSEVPAGSCDDDVLKGCCLGDYEFEHLLGLGGGGAVFAASGPPELPALAVKVIARPPGESDDTMFAREVEIGRRLRHPSVVAIYDSLENEIARFVVMERVVGRNLSAELGAPWAPSRVLKTFGALAEGIHYAHQQGVVHRDLKPENIRVTEDGCVKILDFGLAQLEGSDQFTMSGQFKGTPMHTSPEQIKSSKNVTPACDQFSLGLMLFEAISGEFPYEVDPAQPILALFARMDQPAKRLRSVSAEHSVELDEVLARMLAMEPGDRFATVEEAFAALSAVL